MDQSRQSVSQFRSELVDLLWAIDRRLNAHGCTNLEWPVIMQIRA